MVPRGEKRAPARLCRNLSGNRNDGEALFLSPRHTREAASSMSDDLSTPLLRGAEKESAQNVLAADKHIAQALHAAQSRRALSDEQRSEAVDTGKVPVSFRHMLKIGGGMNRGMKHLFKCLILSACISAYLIIGDLIMIHTEKGYVRAASLFASYRVRLCHVSRVVQKLDNTLPVLPSHPKLAYSTTLPPPPPLLHSSPHRLLCLPDGRTSGRSGMASTGRSPPCKGLDTVTWRLSLEGARYACDYLLLILRRMLVMAP